MEKIYIYGTGSKAVKFSPALSLKYEVIGFLDSNQALKGQYLLGLRIHHLSEIQSGTYDRIVIASSYIDEINQILFDAGNANGVAVENLPEVIELLKQYSGLNIYYRPQSNLPQIPLKEEHLANASLITDRIKLLEFLPKGGLVAELGVANGDYSSQIIKINKPQKLHLIDIWLSERYNETLFENVCSRFSLELTTDEVKIHRKLSVEAVNDFPDGYFDWIYIDTSHCYIGTKAELECYASKIKPGGVIAGHDYTMGNWDKDFRYGVIEAVH